MTVSFPNTQKVIWLSLCYLTHSGPINFTFRLPGQTPETFLKDCTVLVCCVSLQEIQPIKAASQLILLVKSDSCCGRLRCLSWRGMSSGGVSSGLVTAGFP